MLPGFVDSHAHLVFAGQRSAEFAARMAGQSYAAGGIRATVAATRAASDEELRAGLAARQRDAPAGHDGIRVQVGVRADRRGRKLAFPPAAAVFTQTERSATKFSSL